MARLVALGDAHLGRSHLAHLRDDQGRIIRVTGPQASGDAAAIAYRYDAQEVDRKSVV